MQNDVEDVGLFQLAADLHGQAYAKELAGELAAPFAEQSGTHQAAAG